MDKNKIEEAKTILLSKFEDTIRFWERKTNKTFPKAEITLFQEITINKLIDTISDKEAYSVFLESFTIINGILMNFSPSEYYHDRQVTQSIFDKNHYSYKWTTEEQEIWIQEIFKNHGESFFWLGMGDAGDLQWQQAKKHFELALRDNLLRRKVIITIFVMKAWCNAHLHQWEEVKSDIDALTNEVKPRSKESWQIIDYLKGYFSALMEYDIDVQNAPPILLLPETELDEVDLTYKTMFTPELLQSQLASLPNMLVEIVQSTIRKEFDERLIIGPEIIRERLLKEGKLWVDNLPSPGTLLEAESYYQTLKSRTWKIPIYAFASAVESTLKERLVNNLALFLNNNNNNAFKLFDRNGISYSFTEQQDKINLFFFVLFFEQVQSNKTITDFFNYHLHSVPFKELKILAIKLDRFRDIYNEARHSKNEPGVKDGINARDLVLGVKSDPGILELILKNTPN
jgi:hypothetical protein